MRAGEKYLIEGGEIIGDETVLFLPVDAAAVAGTHATRTAYSALALGNIFRIRSGKGAFEVSFRQMIERIVGKRR